MIPGMGAVATTLIAGVEAIRRGLAKPIGSTSQMATIRLGKRTEGRSPLIKDFVPIAKLDDLVFTGWDIFGGNLYDAAKTAQVLDRDQLEQIKPFLQSIEPGRPADIVKLRSGKNRVHCVPVGRSVGGRLFEAVEVGAETLQPGADGSCVRGVIFLVIPPDIALQAFG